jgi:ATP/maltotriose-dependent transcriptional regulator MalT
MKTDWDYVEQLIENALSERIRTYDSYKYMVIDDYHVLVKVYEDNQLIFTIKFWFHGGKLEVVEAW